jgi:hypothetical protein
MNISLIGWRQTSFFLSLSRVISAAVDFILKSLFNSYTANLVPAIIHSCIIHTYHSRFVPEGVAEISQIIPRDTFYQNGLAMNTAEVTGAHHLWSHFISGVSADNLLVAFNDIHERKEQMLFCPGHHTQLSAIIMSEFAWWPTIRESQNFKILRCFHFTSYYKTVASRCLSLRMLRSLKLFNGFWCGLF